MKTQPTCPMPHTMLPHFSLLSSEGRRIRLSDYRGRHNLVLIFTGGSTRDISRRLLSDLARHYREFVREEAEVLAVVQRSRREAESIKRRGPLPFPVLADEDGQIHWAVGALTSDGKTTTTIFVTDRFGEIYAVYQRNEGNDLPPVMELLEWLRFIELQCPECGISEWPA